MRGYPASKMAPKQAVSPLKRESNAVLCELMRGYAVLFEWSGLRESNPSDWLGKPGHYHYAKPAHDVR